MDIQTISLPTGATLTAYLHPRSAEMQNPYTASRATLILCPGGGYSMLSDRENVPPAMLFFNMGFQVFVLSYSVGAAAANRRPLEELGRSVQLVRANREAWNIDPNRVAVLGFSAGGHLAASLGVHWNDPVLLERCNAQDARALRPDALILAYPVITDGAFTHAETLQNISAARQEPPHYWALETHVTADTPPTFLWHTMDDACVPVENSILFLQALHRAGVPCECHLYMHGQHGLSVCTGEVDCGQSAAKSWIALCRTWIESIWGDLGGY